MKNLFTLLLALFVASPLWAQDFWKELPAERLSPELKATSRVPVKAFRALEIDLEALRALLERAPLENTDEARTRPLRLPLPLPDGSEAAFEVVESPILEPALAARFPEIRTYAGRRIDRPAETTRFDISPYGFNAIVHTAEGTVLIAPLAQGDSRVHRSYYQRDVQFDTPPEEVASCEVNENHPEYLPEDPFQYEDSPWLPPSGRRGGQVLTLHTYRAAIAVTGNYYQQHGNSMAAVLANVTSVLNKVNSLFIRDHAIRMELIDETTQMFFDNPNTDPYTNGDAAQLAVENQAQMTAILGADAFDIGHVFGTNTGGIAFTGGVCSPNFKARASSSTFGAYSTDCFYIIVAHEMGHQFSALHNFNLCDMENESPSTGYEPGAGSTVMCYSGASTCNNYWLQPKDDDYYHNNAILRINAFSRDPNAGGSCAQTQSIPNDPPSVNIPLEGGFTIPIETPFELTAQGSDPNGDDITYCWEQYDLGPESPLGSPSPNGTPPLFRSLPPTSSPTRTFPKLTTILSNGTDPQEVLPFTTRDLTFRVTVRDNHPDAGGIAWQEIKFQSTANAGPFRVLTNNAAGAAWTQGDYLPVQWEVANTDKNPVNCQHVNILLSTDGGFTFPHTLAENVPNDGEHFVVVPRLSTNNARLRIEAADNIFFDINDANFAIEEVSEPTIFFELPFSETLVCLPDVLEIPLLTDTLGGFNDTLSFQVEGLPAGAQFNIEPNQPLPGQAILLSIDFSGVTESGLFPVTVSASAQGVATQTRNLLLDIVSTDFSALQLLTPTDGKANASTLEEFTWTPLDNADSYAIEIATSPAFGASVVDQASGLTTTSYFPSITLEENTVYFWRVRAVNRCADGWSPVAAFQTIALSCSSLESNDGPIGISGAGLPVIQSNIFVNSSGTISDINVLKVMGDHDAVADLEFRLISPEGTQVVLLSKHPCNSTLFDLGFDDEAPPASIPCPPNTGFTYQPQEPLAAFQGEDVQGNWTLEVAVVNELGTGGTFQKWALEFCGTIEGTNANPELTVNDTLRGCLGESRVIFNTKLRVTDPDNGASELVFTLVTPPLFGELQLSGTPLGAGDTFTQADINAGDLLYVHTAAQSLPYDSFSFVVSDGNGGFLGTPVFNIRLDDPPCETAVTELPENAFRLYPNPASGTLFVEFPEAVSDARLELLDLQGRVLRTHTQDGPAQTLRLDLQGMPAGMYLLKVELPEGVGARKVVVE